MVFDAYKDVSIKNVERSKRATETDGITYKNILPGFQVKSWSSMLGVLVNKTETYSLPSGRIETRGV